MLYIMTADKYPAADERKEKSSVSVNQLSNHSHIICGHSLFLLCLSKCCNSISLLRVYSMILSLPFPGLSVSARQQQFEASEDQFCVMTYCCLFIPLSKTYG